MNEYSFNRAHAHRHTPAPRRPQREGLFRADLSPTTAAKIFFGAIDEMATHGLLGRGGSVLASDADGVVDVFSNGVRSR